MKLLRKLVVKKRLNNPCSTLQQIAETVGVTKERVRQILVSENLPTRRWKPRSYKCNNCGLIFPAVNGRVCKFCSPECRKEYYQATLPCDECGKLFTLSYGVIRKRVKFGCQHFYCSQRCRGIVAGKKYGFIAHPENSHPSSYKSQPCKWLKLAPKINEMLKQGWLLNNILVELGIPKGSLCLIKKMIVENTIGTVPTEHNHYI